MLRTVEKGKHDFQPGDEAWITWSNKVEGHFYLDKSMYFTREDADYPHGDDAADWNKVTGLTWALSGNANWSAMIAWRPDEKNENRFEIALYVNPKSGGFKAEKVTTVAADEIVFFRLTWVSGRAVLAIRKEDEKAETFAQLPLKNVPWWFRFYREIGPWFGGNRAAHREMRMWLKKY